MRIVKLTAENIKRLQAVEITPDGNLVKITGKNGAGKTSVLDAIWWALAGGDNIQSKPIRDGQDKAKVTLDLGDIVVERRFTKSGTTLVVSNKDGARFPSPQKMLDELVGRLTFDPLEFMRMDPRKAAETLRALVNLDFTDHENRRRLAYDKRTTVNRELANIEAQASAITVSADAPDAEVDPADLVAKLQEAEQVNRKNAGERNALAQNESNLTKMRQAVADAKEALALAERLLASDEAVAERVRKTVAELEDVDVAPIQSAIANSKQLNEAARAKANKKALRSRVIFKQSESDDLTQQILAIDEEKAQLLREAPFPVPGLGFNDAGAVTFQDVPIEQISAAEQLRVSVAMAMAMNPKLRVLRITDGSLLDSTSLQIIEQMAKDGDYQVWMEIVDETGKLGVVIEDGCVRADKAA